MSTTTEIREEAEGLQRYADVSDWIKHVMGKLFELTLSMPQDNQDEALSVVCVRTYHIWKLRCTCSVESKDGPLTQLEAQQAVQRIAIADGEKRYWRHPFKDGVEPHHKPKAYYSGGEGRVAVHVALETIE